MQHDAHDLTPRLLPDWQVLQVDGADALAFLQRQTMNDVAALPDGGWHWNGLLSAKGRVLSLFALLRRDARTAWLLLPDQPIDELVALLRPFVLRSKLALASRSDLRVVAGPAAATPGAADLQARIDLPATQGARWLGIVDAAQAGGFEADDGRWKFEDLAAGIPRLDADQRDAWTPHMLGLDRLPAFSLKKGCYPGQEIVARTHYLGRAKRGPWRLLAATAIAPGAALRDAAGAEVGRVVGTASSGGRHVALAVAPLDMDPTGWRAGETPVKADSPGAATDPGA